MKALRFLIHVGLLVGLMSLVACDDDTTETLPINEAKKYEKTVKPKPIVIPVKAITKPVTK